MNPDIGHRQLDHTADLAMEIWAPDEASMLLEGARAMVELLTDGVAIRGAARRAVEIDALDAEDRLVQWLNEVLFMATVDGFLLENADISLSVGGLRAEILGEADAFEKVQTELKSVTYHDLALRHEDRRVTARVVIDV